MTVLAESANAKCPMNKEQISYKLTSVFQKIFADADLRISREMTADDVASWDSLRHIQLISAVETEFGIRFKLREVVSMKNVGDLIDLVHAKKPVPA